MVRMMDQNKAVSNTLLSEGKSTRLMALRKKAMGESVPSQSAKVELVEIEGLDRTTRDEFLQIRRAIEQRLADILKKYPTNKQAGFFKIRFGMSVEQLKRLSIKEICSVIGLEQISFSGVSIVATLDYVGNVVAFKRKIFR